MSRANRSNGNGWLRSFKEAARVYCFPQTRSLIRWKRSTIRPDSPLVGGTLPRFRDSERCRCQDVCSAKFGAGGSDVCSSAGSVDGRGEIRISRLPRAERASDGFDLRGEVAADERDSESAGGTGIASRGRHRHPLPSRRTQPASRQLAASARIFESSEHGGRHRPMGD